MPAINLVEVKKRSYQENVIYIELLIKFVSKRLLNRGIFRISKKDDNFQYETGTFCKYIATTTINVHLW